MPLAWCFPVGEGGTRSELVLCGKQIVNTVGLTTTEISTSAGQDQKEGPLKVLEEAS